MGPLLHCHALYFFVVFQTKNGHTRTCAHTLHYATAFVSFYPCLSPLPSPTPLLGLATAGSVGGDVKLPAFDVKAYTFRKKSRHYVAVKQGNALRIEPIIYLKTSILDHQQDVVRNWDYLRFSPHRFRDNALPKKKLTAEGTISLQALEEGLLRRTKQNG